VGRAGRPDGRNVSGALPRGPRAGGDGPVTQVEFT
jgi:hypothetical protein